MTDASASSPGRNLPIVRIGGGLMLAAMVIHIVANLVLKQMPDAGMTVQVTQAYLAAEQGTWALVHGLRYLAMVCMAVFYAALFVFCSGRAESAGWEVLGLLGGLLHIANLLIANGLEMLAFASFETASGDPELFWLAFSASRMLFDAELITWAIAMIGFGIAGWRTRALPVWLCAIGFLCAGGSILAGAFVYSMLAGGWAGMVASVASLAGLVWFLAVATVMLLRGR